jgi:hypothetical protein
MVYIWNDDYFMENGYIKTAFKENFHKKIFKN